MTVGGRTFVGTAGRGLWLAGQHPTALTPDDQICSNHVVAVARFRGDVWLGTFDQVGYRFTGVTYQAQQNSTATTQSSGTNTQAGTTTQANSSNGTRTVFTTLNNT